MKELYQTVLMLERPLACLSPATCMSQTGRLEQNARVEPVMDTFFPRCWKPLDWCEGKPGGAGPCCPSSTHPVHCEVCESHSSVYPLCFLCGCPSLSSFFLINSGLLCGLFSSLCVPITLGMKAHPHLSLHGPADSLPGLWLSVGSL